MNLKDHIYFFLSVATDIWIFISGAVLLFGFQLHTYDLRQLAELFFFSFFAALFTFLGFGSHLLLRLLLLLIGYVMVYFAVTLEVLDVLIQPTIPLEVITVIFVTSATGNLLLSTHNLHQSLKQTSWLAQAVIVVRMIGMFVGVVVAAILTAVVSTVSVESTEFPVSYSTILFSIPITVYLLYVVERKRLYRINT